MQEYDKRGIRSYVLRTGRLSRLQKNALETLSDRYSIPFQNKHINFEKIFGNNNPVIIEIGFGMGHATAEIADKNRHKNYIGIEVHTPGVGKLLSRIDILNLSNLRIIQYDAVHVIRTMVPSGSLQGVHIFFPDPWPKKKHNKRRLIKHEFIEELLPLIKKDGYIYAVTDWEDYAEQILRVFNKFTELKNPYGNYADGIEWRPDTSFEKKGIKKNHKIREIWEIVL